MKASTFKLLLILLAVIALSALLIKPIITGLVVYYVGGVLVLASQSAFTIGLGAENVSNTTRLVWTTTRNLYLPKGAQLINATMVLTGFGADGKRVSSRQADFCIGNYLVGVDVYDDKLYALRYDPTGVESIRIINISPSASLPYLVEVGNFTLDAANAVPSGVATNGSDFWVTDREDDLVYHYNASGSLLENFSLDAENANSTGIVTNGSDFWVTDTGTKRIYVYNSTFSLLSNFSLGSIVPVDISRENETLWIADCTTPMRVHMYYTNGSSAGYNFNLEGTSCNISTDPVPDSRLAQNNRMFWSGEMGSVCIAAYSRATTYPENIELDVNADGTVDWNYSAPLNFSTTAEFNASLAAALSTCTKISASYCTIQVNFSSDWPAYLEYSNISINYNMNLPNITACLNTINNTEGACVLQEPDSVHIIEGGSYSVTAPPSLELAVIVMNASNQTLDCNGTEIVVHGLMGIVIGQGINNSVIKGCTLTGGWRSIVATNTSGTRIINNSITAYEGIVATNTSGTRIINNSITASEGIVFYVNTSNAQLSGNNIGSAMSQSGIQIWDDGLWNSSFFNNNITARDGIDVVEGFVSDSKFFNNSLINIENGLDVLGRPNYACKSIGDIENITNTTLEFSPPVSGVRYVLVHQTDSRLDWMNIHELWVYNSSYDIVSINRTVAASGWYSVYEPSRAVNGNLSDFWNNDGWVGWFRVDLGSEQTVSRIMIACEGAKGNTGYIALLAENGEIVNPINLIYDNSFSNISNVAIKATGANITANSMTAIGDVAISNPGFSSNIVANTITNSSTGILLTAQTSSLVAQNIVTDSSGIGIELSGAGYPIVVNNTVTNSAAEGLRTNSAGIYANNTLSNNGNISSVYLASYSPLSANSTSFVNEIFVDAALTTGVFVMANNTTIPFANGTNNFDLFLWTDSADVLGLGAGTNFTAFVDSASSLTNCSDIETAMGGICYYNKQDSLLAAGPGANYTFTPGFVASYSPIFFGGNYFSDSVFFVVFGSSPEYVTVENTSIAGANGTSNYDLLLGNYSGFGDMFTGFCAGCASAGIVNCSTAEAAVPGLTCFYFKQNALLATGPMSNYVWNDSFNSSYYVIPGYTSPPRLAVPVSYLTTPPRLDFVFMLKKYADIFADSQSTLSYSCNGSSCTPNRMRFEGNFINRSTTLLEKGINISSGAYADLALNIFRLAVNNSDANSSLCVDGEGNFYEESLTPAAGDCGQANVSSPGPGSTQLGLVRLSWDAQSSPIQPVYYDVFISGGVLNNALLTTTTETSFNWYSTPFSPGNFTLRVVPWISGSRINGTNTFVSFSTVRPGPPVEVEVREVVRAPTVPAPTPITLTERPYTAELTPAKGLLFIVEDLGPTNYALSLVKFYKEDGVVLLLEPGPEFFLDLGEQKEFDLNGDGKNDIYISLIALPITAVKIELAKLPVLAPPPVVAPPVPPVAPVVELPAPPPPAPPVVELPLIKRVKLWQIVVTALALIALICLAVLLVLLKRRRERRLLAAGEGWI